MKKFLSITLLFFSTVSLCQPLMKLDSLLSKDLSIDPKLTGKWVYYPESANIQKIDKPALNKLFPNSTFYKASLTNILGWHVNSSTCLILYDTVNTKITLVEPMWYSNQNEIFLNSFIGVKFKESKSLFNVISELQDLLIIGTNGKFDNTQYKGNNVAFDLTVVGNSKFDTVQTIEVLLLDNSIISFNFSNPKMHKNQTIL